MNGQGLHEIRDARYALCALGEIGLQFESIAEIDINPLKVRRDGKPVAVDALIVLTA